MPALPSPLLRQACRLFLELAYPDGPQSIPERRRAYLDLPADERIGDFVPPAPAAAGIAKEIYRDSGDPCGFEFRLGSNHFPHLKLRLQEVEHNGQACWVFMVDTHDAFSKESRFPPPDHPDAERWLALQGLNRELKERIEAVFEQHGLTTVNALLRGDLERRQNSSS